MIRALVIPVGGVLLGVALMAASAPVTSAVNGTVTVPSPSPTPTVAAPTPSPSTPTATPTTSASVAVPAGISLSLSASSFDIANALPGTTADSSAITATVTSSGPYTVTEQLATPFTNATGATMTIGPMDGTAFSSTPQTVATGAATEDDTIPLSWVFTVAPDQAPGTYSGVINISANASG